MFTFVKCIYKMLLFVAAADEPELKYKNNNNNNIKRDLPRAEASERRGERSSCCPVLATGTDCQQQQRPTRRLVPASVPGESAYVSNAGNAHQAAL